MERMRSKAGPKCLRHVMDWRRGTMRPCPGRDVVTMVAYWEATEPQAFFAGFQNAFFLMFHSLYDSNQLCRFLFSSYFGKRRRGMFLQSGTLAEGF